MEEKLLDNLRRNQAFDESLKKGKSIDKLVAALALLILQELDAAKRETMIQRLADQIVNEFRTAYQPAAVQLALHNARRVLEAMGSASNPLSQSAPVPAPSSDNRRLLADMTRRDRDRAEIVRAAVDDHANTLSNEIKAYRLEPGDSQQQKTTRLLEQHREQEQKRLEYDKKSEAFNRGEVDTRPRKPQLDGVSRFAEDSKQSLREQARRTGTDAETATFVKAGHATLAWVTVNASEACPDCRLRQGVQGDLAFWDQWGRPGSGRTICKTACFCMLVPASAVTNHPGLKNGLNQPRKGVFTSPADAAALNNSRGASQPRPSAKPLTTSAAPPKPANAVQSAADVPAQSVPPAAPAPQTEPVSQAKAAKNPILSARKPELATPPKKFAGNIVYVGTSAAEVEAMMKELKLRGSARDAVSACVPNSDLFDTVHVQAGQGRITVVAEKDGVGEVKRTIRKRLIHNDLFALDPSQRRHGLDFFRSQVVNAQAIGVRKLETYAAGRWRHPIYNGYYTWPRFGYDGELNAHHLDDAPEEYRQFTLVSQIMATPEGREWWQKNGSSISLEFDLSQTSKNMRILRAYLKERERDRLDQAQ